MADIPLRIRRYANVGRDPNIDNGGMTYPRYRLVDPDRVGFYHVTSRCVRRAFLCGQDAVSGRNFDHRREWIEELIFRLAARFAAQIYAYAIMANHYHIVLRIDPEQAKELSDAEVARRWLTRHRDLTEPELEQAQRQLTALPTRIACLRERLGNLSWFMRCLNEPVARRANREDGCTGRFWEGRFGCQALLDERAVLSGMVYSDLNPVRAGVSRDLPSSAYTSIRSRLAKLQGSMAQLSVLESEPIQPIAGAPPPIAPLSCTLGAYLSLADWSGRRFDAKKRGRISDDAPPLLTRLGASSAAWLTDVGSLESRYWLAIGSTVALARKAESMGQRWLKGVRNAWQLQQAAEGG